ncbi:hypothetical protein ACI2KR_06845 [Pseudomonas luteola]
MRAALHFASMTYLKKQNFPFRFASQPARFSGLFYAHNIKKMVYKFFDNVYNMRQLLNLCLDNLYCSSLNANKAPEGKTMTFAAEMSQLTASDFFEVINRNIWNDLQTFSANLKRDDDGSLVEKLNHWKAKAEQFKWADNYLKAIKAEIRDRF